MSKRTGQRDADVRKVSAEPGALAERVRRVVEASRGGRGSRMARVATLDWGRAARGRCSSRVLSPKRVG